MKSGWEIVVGFVKVALYQWGVQRFAPAFWVSSRFLLVLLFSVLHTVTPESSFGVFLLIVELVLVLVLFVWVIVVVVVL